MARAGNLSKVLDRKVGIPLGMVLGAIRRRRGLPGEIRTIALFKEACIGDTILLAGLVPDLRAAFPGARLVFFAGPSNCAAAAMLGVDEVVGVPITNPVRAIPALRSRSVDVLLDFGQWPRINAVYSWFASSRFTVGFDTPGQHRAHAYDAVVPHRDDVHELENFRALLRPLGIKSRTPPRIEAGPVPRGFEGMEYVVCHPWPGGTLSHVREWPQQRWIELVRRFREDGLEVVVTGGPADRDRAEELVAQVGGDEVRNLAGVGGLAAVAGLLAGARCVVSVNTGIMHLAAAVGAPTLGLNGPTSERRWGPIGPRTTCASVPPPHGGYLHLGFEYAGRPIDCMQRIGLEDVWVRAQGLLERSQADAPLRAS